MEECKITSGNHDRQNALPSDIHLEHVFKGKKTVCLICAHFIEGIGDSLESESALNNHLLSVKHSTSMAKLFKQFLKDDPNSYSFNSKYLDIVNNSILHVTIALQQPSYIFQQDNSVFCEVCLTDICDSAHVDSYLLDHLYNRSHAYNIMDVGQWVYFFSKNNDKLVFKKDSIYCSHCDVSFNLGNEKKFLHVAANHIERKHTFVNAVDSDILNVNVGVVGIEQLSVPPLSLIDLDGEELTTLFEKQMDENTQTLLLKNQGYIKIVIGRNKYYVCICCKSFFSKDNFNAMISHLLGNKHRRGVSSGVKDCKELISYISSKDMAKPTVKNIDIEQKSIFEVFKILKARRTTIKLNYQFIKDKEGAFYCAVCKISVPFNKAGQQLVDHCKGSEHNDVLSEKFDSYVARFDDGPCENTTCERRKEIENDLACARNSSGPILLQNNAKLIRIKDNNYFCLLCNVPIAFDKLRNGCALFGHYISKLHAKRLYTVFCNGVEYEFEFFTVPKSLLDLN